MTQLYILQVDVPRILDWISFRRKQIGRERGWLSSSQPFFKRFYQCDGKK